MGAMEYIKSRLCAAELLAGLGEEAAELGQAALKHRRAITGTNPTPLSPVETITDLLGVSVEHLVGSGNKSDIANGKSVHGVHYRCSLREV